jgi:type I restriction enzyme S subunit
MYRPLSELATLEYGKSPNDVRDPDGIYPIYGTGGLVGYANKRLFKNNGVVVARKGTLDKPCYVEGDYWVIDTAYATIPNDGVDPKWLYYCLDSFDLKKLNEATGVPSISRDYLYRIKFCTPAYAQQQKIAKILSTVDNLIEKTQSLIDKYTAVKQGMMADLFTSGIDLTPGDNYGQLRPSVTEAPELYQQTELGWVPKDWDVIELGKICHKITDGSHQSVKTTEDGDVPFLFVSSIRNGQVLWDKTALITKDDYAIISKGREPKKGDVLYTAVGSYGYAACVDEDAEFSFQRHIAYIKPDGALINSFFLTELLNFGVMKCWADKVALGNAQKTVTLGELAKYPIILPTYAEQEVITNNIEKINDTINTETKTISKYKNVKKGLMQDLLTGKVRVYE